MSDFNSLLRPALVLGALILSAAAYAQAVETGAPPSVRALGSRPQMPRLPGERIEPELAYTKTALNLTGAQIPLWDRVADVLRAQAKRRDDAIRFEQSAHENDGKNAQIDVKDHLIDGLETMQRKFSAESDDLAKLLAALKPFYASLSDQQKTVADEIVRPGPGGPHEFGPRGLEMPMIDHGPMGPSPFAHERRPEAGR